MPAAIPDRGEPGELEPPALWRKDGEMLRSKASAASDLLREAWSADSLEN